MIINLRTIDHRSRHYELALEPTWWVADEDNDQIIGLDAPLETHITIYKAGDKYVLEGRVSGGLQVICDRCLDTYHLDLESVFRLFLALPLVDTEPTEIELAAEDMALDFITGDEIDVEEIIREQIYLSLPMKFLCDENCMGICPGCGVNLNKETCQCRQEAVNPAFRRLADLKDKGETT